MPVIVITPPAPLVSLADAKAQVREVENDEDGLIEGYIAAASAWVDGPTGWLDRSFGAQVLEWRSQSFAGCGHLPFGPVSAVVSVKYVDPQGIEQTLSPDQYTVTSDGLYASPGASWPTVRGDIEGVRIRYEAGSNEIPDQVRQAVMLLVGQWYRNRMSVVVGTISSEIPFGVEALLNPLRRFR